MPRGVGYPVVTIGLIAACVLVFLWQSWLSPAARSGWHSALAPSRR